MFDANMRHLPKGLRFFGNVHSCQQGKLFDAGIRRGDIVLCTMLSIGHSNPRVKFHLPSGSVTARSWDDDDEAKCLDYLIVFEGRTDGHSFICDKSKAKALAVLGGEWEVDSDMKPCKEKSE